MIDALDRVVGHDVPRETSAKLARYVSLLVEENDRQNLIAKSTASEAWARHVLDSAQLLPLLADAETVIDVGSGAGLPGLVLALLSPAHIHLVEPRRLRAGFLERCIIELAIPNASVECQKVERVEGAVDVITARAVAPLTKFLALTHHLAHSGTRWVLPKGRNGAIELAEARRAWQGDFRIVPSLTSSEAGIVVAEHIMARGGRGK